MPRMMQPVFWTLHDRQGRWAAITAQETRVGVMLNAAPCGRDKGKDTKMTLDSPSWIGMDWGAAGVRVWVHDATDHIIAETRIPSVGVHQIADQLAVYLPGNQTTPVICSGLPFIPASAYPAVPAAAVAGLLQVQSDDPRLQLLAVPGLSQKKPLDLMCGCETAISGVLATDPEFDGVICCIDSKSTWAQISAGEVVSFQSFLTPEITASLIHAPMLAQAVTQGGLVQDDFAEALDTIMARPQSFGAELARISAVAALTDNDAATGWSRLMGAAIGLELSGARPYWLGQRVMILGEDVMAPLYVAALAHAGLQAETQGRDDAVLAGLRHIHKTYVAAK